VSDLPPLEQPYRSVALLHAALAVVILAVAAISGGSLVKAFVVAVAYFVVATGWSWFRLRRRKAKAARGSTRGGGEAGSS
jgi:uncharacterized protein (DUF58 family)